VKKTRSGLEVKKKLAREGRPVGKDTRTPRKKWRQKPEKRTTRTTLLFRARGADQQLNLGAALRWGVRTVYKGCL